MQKNPEAITEVVSSDRERPPTTVSLIAPEGLGFGEGGISVKSQIEQGILKPETPTHIYEFLTNDSRAFKPIETQDDGCGDGRPWRKVVQKIRDENGEYSLRFSDTSKYRAKVFGGGLVTASSMWRAIQGTPSNSDTVGNDRTFMASKLAERNIIHGAHTDDHAEGESCGCGAIDKYPAISENALKYREQITATLELLYGAEFEENQHHIDKAFAVYSDIVQSQNYFSDASGKLSMEVILDSGAVVKELSGHHIEETIVINDVEGTTLDQRLFTETIKNNSGKEKPRIVQAFSVDIWRGKQLAKQVAEIATEHEASMDVEAVEKLAYADFLIRTLAVAATLTAGDLPVFSHSEN